MSTPSSNEIERAATADSRGQSPRAVIAPATISIDASSTISRPAPNRGGSAILPTVPPIVLASPPPMAFVVNHGSIR